jgi:cyclopropane fatty-acyl-phospholipid synthase-like methyltransferase
MSLPTGYFEQLYRSAEDPWSFRTRWYEERKRALTLASLRRRRYGSCFEPGCSLGLLTAELAARCDNVIACDVSDRALHSAQDNVSTASHVSVLRRGVPDWWPAGPFDLVVVSEIGYYFDVDTVRSLWRAARASLEPGGDLVAVHWRHPVAEYPLTGDAVHELLADTGGLERTLHHEESDFLLDIYTRVPPAAQSIATIEGLR